MTNETLRQLVTLSNELARPERDLVILGEGNTSARAGDSSFWVKASGYELHNIAEDGFVQVAFDRVLEILDGPALTDEQIKQGLVAAKVDPAPSAGHPSVETMLHAQCLRLEGVRFVAHTHPIAVNSLTCSTAFEIAYSGRLFPDEIVVCGPAPMLVPYVDPGLPLAREFRTLLARHADVYGELPKTILMQNHGLIALGSSALDVDKITQMAVKTARILLGALSAGGPRFMSQKDVDRIHTRPDEHFRRQQLKLI